MIFGYLVIEDIAKAFDPFGADRLEAKCLRWRKPTVFGNQSVYFQANSRGGDYCFMAIT